MSLRLPAASVILSALTITISAETHCPKSIRGLPTRFVGDSLIVTSIRVNNRGPYDFLVDTGAQISTVDSSLASDLRLQVQGTAGVSGATSYGRRTLANLELVTAGEKSVAGLAVVIQDLSDLKHADRHIRGILGDNFLERFDFLLDNRRKLLCLDDTNTLALAIRGEHIPLVEPNGPPTDLPFTKPLLIAARTTVLEKPLKLRLDSGTNVAMLHRTNLQFTKLVSTRTSALRHVDGGIEQAFMVLPSSDLAIGSHRFRNLQFVMPMNPVMNLPAPREDGILPTSGFESVFISSSGRYAIFETW